MFHIFLSFIKYYNISSPTQKILRDIKFLNTYWTVGGKKNRLSTLEFIFNMVLSFFISSHFSYTSNVHRNEKCEKNVGVFKFQKKLLISFFFTIKSILTFRDLKISFLVTCCKNTC